MFTHIPRKAKTIVVCILYVLKGGDEESPGLQTQLAALPNATLHCMQQNRSMHLLPHCVLHHVFTVRAQELRLNAIARHVFK